MSIISYLYGGLSASTISAVTISTANLNISSPGTGTSIASLGVDASGNVVSGATSGGGGSSYWTSGSSGSYSVKAINDTNIDAVGSYSVAEGFNTTAAGNRSHAEGSGSIAGVRAFSISSVSNGVITISNNIDYTTTFSGSQVYLIDSAPYFGPYSFTSTTYSAPDFIINLVDTSINSGSFIVDTSNLTSPLGINFSIGAHAEGESIAFGEDSHSEGQNTIAVGGQAHTEGYGTRAIGNNSHAQGSQAIALGENSHAGGYISTASGITSFIHSSNSLVTGDRSVVLGGQNITGTTADTVYVPYLHVINESTFDQKVTLSNGVNLTDSSNTSTIDISSGSYNQYNFGTGLNRTVIYQDNSGIELTATYNGFSSNTTGTAGISIVRNGGGSWSDAILMQGNYDNDITNSGGPYYTGIIINSAQSTIKSGITGTVILGGQNITGTTSDTIYVSNLNINTTPSNDDALTQVLVRDTDGTIKYRSSSSLSGASSSSGSFGIADTGGTYTYYSSFSQAMSAATSGQTIEMFADIVESGAVTITLKDGVNINGNGHTYIHSYAGGNSNTLENTSGVISCVISNIRIIRTGRSNGTAGDYVLNTSVNDSQFLFQGVFFESTYGNCVSLGGTNWQYKPHTGDLYAKAYLTAITTQGSIVGFKGQSTSSGKGIYGLGGLITSCVGMSISGDGINGVGNNCYGFSSSGIGLAGTFSNSYGNSVTYRAADGGAYYNCVLVSTSGYAATNGQYKNCTCISSSGSGAGPYLLNKHDNCYIESASNVAVGGTYTGIFRNCVVVSDWNNSGGHGFNIGSGSIITNSHIKVANTSANCIYYGSAINIKYASNVFEGATTPVNANITQPIVNTQDNQGNILL